MAKRSIIDKLITGDTNQLRELNETQTLFCEWNAQRLGISFDEARARYAHSWSLFRRGHEGSRFRMFCDTSYDLFSVFINDSPNEVYEAYAFHQHLHFLRMIGYEYGEWPQDEPAAQYLSGLDEITIVDFGCGLAQLSRSLALQLIAKGKRVHLCLVDIPTIRKDFLCWVGQRTGIPTSFLDSTRESGFPEMPKCHLVVATEVLEHIHEPLQALDLIDRALLPGGYLRTSIDDHGAGFMHVSPDLKEVRDALAKRGYAELEPNTLYRKPLA